MKRICFFLKEARKIARGSKMNYFLLLISFMICRLVHGASWDNFHVLEMYNYRYREKKKIYTFRRQKKISDNLNKNAGKDELNILMEKNRFNTVFSDFIKRDWFDPKASDVEGLKSFLSKNERFLVKPVLSSQGKGIEMLYSSEIDDAGRFYKDLVKRTAILEAFIKQHSAVSEINSSSVNTIRLITAKKNGKVHIINGGCIRCGGKGSFVDNFHNGGVAYPIDISTGIVDGQGYSLGVKTRFIKHPSSGKNVLGFQIPDFENIKETVIRAAKVMENVGYIGWDIAVLEDGCEIIEANVNYPGTNIIQLDGFNAYEKVIEFMNK